MYVYAMTDTSPDKRIKIGKSVDPPRRARNLGLKLLVATHVGEPVYYHESQAHQACAEYHIDPAKAREMGLPCPTEWFRGPQAWRHYQAWAAGCVIPKDEAPAPSFPDGWTLGPCAKINGRLWASGWKDVHSQVVLVRDQWFRFWCSKPYRPYSIDWGTWEHHITLDHQAAYQGDLLFELAVADRIVPQVPAALNWDHHVDRARAWYKAALRSHMGVEQTQSWHMVEQRCEIVDGLRHTHTVERLVQRTRCDGRFRAHVREWAQPFVELASLADDAQCEERLIWKRRHY